MITPDRFSGVISTILPSQDREVLLVKQQVLAEHGKRVRSAFDQLPPEVSAALLASYAAPTNALLNGIEATVLFREHAIENAHQGVGLDQQWLAAANPRGFDEVGIGSEDPWNTLE